MSAVDVASSPIRIGPGFVRNFNECISIITHAESVIPICILKSESTASVKLRIQTRKGFLVKKHKLVFEGKELSRNNSLVKDYVVSSGDILHLVLRDSNLLNDENLGYSLQPVIVNPNLKIHPAIWGMLNSASEGLKMGKKPVRASEGSGGAYFMHDPLGNKIVVFKPIDEEPLAVNNPKGEPPSTSGEGLKRGTKVGEGLKRGTKVGEGALREVAAYILDHPLTGPRSSNSESDKGFAGVPPTIMVKCLNPEFNHPRGYDGGPENIKVGSLQMFVTNCGSCEDIGTRDFPVEEVHKITVFDIRTANADRHAGNILMNREGGEGGRIVLTPIDHGYCLPENFEECTFEWLFWPQAEEPYSKQTLNYIKSLDAEQDIALLNSHGWNLSLECARTLRISTMLLKKGATIGLLPHRIGKIMCRIPPTQESMIEKLVQKAHDLRRSEMSEAAFLNIVSEIMDIELEKC